MSESIALEADAATPLRPSPQSTLLRLGVVFACWAFFLGNLAAIGWIWVANGNLPFHSLAEAMSRLGGLTGLLAAYLALIQVLLLARLPWLEHLAGFDRLTVWHRINGFACLLLVLAHTVMTVYGYGLGNHTSFTSEFWMMVGQGAFPGMVTATIGTALFVVVSISSLVLVRTRLPYELWYAVHLTAYAAIALAWFHEIPVGGSWHSTRAMPTTGAHSSSAPWRCSLSASEPPLWTHSASAFASWPWSLRVVGLPRCG